MHGTKLIYWKIEPARRLSESSGVVYHSLHQVMTSESDEMWRDFRVFGGKEARLDGQLRLVTKGKESHSSCLDLWVEHFGDGSCH